MAEHPTELTLRVRMDPTAVLGLPWFVEVTLANETQGTEYYRLGPCNPAVPPFPVELVFTQGTQHVALPSSGHDRSERGGGAFDLSPGQARTFVLDISELEPALGPGHWHCQATWLMSNEEPRSQATSVEISVATPADVAKLGQLRRSGGARSPNWFNFVKLGDAADVQTARHRVSQQASRALLPYLIMHEAIHGPEALARFPANELLQLSAGAWASEADLLSYELACARRAPDQAQRRAKLLSSWPGLAFRIAHIDRGLGILTRLRRDYGPKEGTP